jgi:putative lipoprotein
MLLNYKLIMLSVAVITVFGCSEHRKTASTEQQKTALTNPPELLSLSGFISSQTPLILSDDAILNLKLEDTAKQDVAAEVLAEQRISIKSAAPWPFTITYDPAKLKHTGRYILRARLEIAGKLHYMNSKPISAFSTQEPINILLSPVNRPSLNAKHESMVLY